MAKNTGQEHWTKEEYNEYMAKQNIKKSKYKSIKSEMDGHVFDSLKEKQYYVVLLVSKRAGEISNFELQPSFVLQEGFRKNGKKYRPITYKADFKVFNNDGTIEIIDVKGFETEVFKIKMKLFEYKYPELSLKII